MTDQKPIQTEGREENGAIPLGRPDASTSDEAVKRTAEMPDVKKRIEDTGSLLILNTPEQFAQQIRAEFDVYKDVVARQKLTLD